MGVMKDFLMSIEERIYDALELGFRTEQDIYAYVHMYERNVDVDTVKQLFERIIGKLDDCDRMIYNETL